MLEPIQIEVVYALPDQVFRRTLKLPGGCTAEEAVKRSDVCLQWPELADRPLRYGIFSRQVQGDHVLRDGDRVEVYRPLQIDPKEARRRRAVRRG